MKIIMGNQDFNANPYETSFNRFAAFVTFAMVAIVTWGIYTGYRENQCAAHCSHRQQICASAPIGGDFVCVSPMTRNVNLTVEEK